MEYWYDSFHTGAMRIIDRDRQIIYGSDPKEKHWEVMFKIIGKNKICVDFNTKKTHRIHKIMIATFTDRQNSLEWSDGNIWRRMRVDPHIVLAKVDSKK